MADEHEEVRERLRARLDILEGLSDALGRMDEINAVVHDSSDRPAARSALMADPFNYSDVVSTHVLDMTVSRQTIQGVEELRQEILKARAFLEDSDWPPT
jgi:DNA gyrase/topoisomerase IV subunit A